ncbi:MAG: PspA/IM30 family protein [Proteobacteria bacterium]|nr:PspA/IM30 family protein [Cystobacterineae bacterium]MCL2314456.1 PspA/IM30 family protein [Pseudomonadota bacterium]
MWNRLMRAIRSFLGAFVNNVEDPELILKQNMRDLSEQIPRMNEQVAKVRANVSLLEKEKERQLALIEKLTSKIKVGIQIGKEELSLQYAQQLQSTKAALAKGEAQLLVAREAYEKAMKVKKAFMLEKERKAQEVMAAMEGARLAKWQAEVADALESFSITGLDATHEEMVRKLNEQAAVNGARMAMAMESIDAPAARVDEEVEKMQAMELIKQMKLEMGMVEVSSVEEASPVLEKTLGKKVDIKS